jgi:hypothetical protein
MIGLQSHPDAQLKAADRAIGSGGFMPARILKTYLRMPILTVGLVYCGEDDKPGDHSKIIQGIGEVEKKLAGKKILLMDEVDDSRVTLRYCIRELMRRIVQTSCIMLRVSVSRGYPQQRCCF